MKGKTKVKKAKVKKTRQKDSGYGKFTMLKVMLMFCFVPMLTATLILSIVITRISSVEIKQLTRSSLLSTIEKAGESLDYSTTSLEITLSNFKTSPLLVQSLLNPDSKTMKAELQHYVDEYYSQLDGCEGLYVMGWDALVYAHSDKSAVGTYTREGERLTELQNQLDGIGMYGVYNAGILKSPTSGAMVSAMYTPIYDKRGKEVGIVGAAMQVSELAERFSHIDKLGVNSAYVYFVAPDGTIVYHHDEDKIGNGVEDEAIKGLLSNLNSKDTGVLEYKCDGDMKYAAYYVGEDARYVAVLSAYESDVLSSVSAIRKLVLSISIVLVIVCSILSYLISKLITAPLANIAEVTMELSKGNVNVKIDVESHVKETVRISKAARDLQEALQRSIGRVKDSSNVLQDTIVDVVGKTNENVTNLGQISSAIEEVADTSQSVALSAQSMSDQAKVLEQSVDELTQSIEVLQGSSKVISDSNDTATEKMGIVLKSSQEAVGAVNEITERVRETNEAISMIGECVTVIEDITDQTNLLSLNASIEAARAGEAGKGFAVVAEEIRNLAENSRKSSQQIKGIIENVIVQSNETVECVGKVAKISSMEQEYIKDTQTQFVELSLEVQNSLSHIGSIRELVNGLERIKESILFATDELGAISEELGASAEEVSATCSSVVEACEQTRGVTNEMENVEKDMLEAVDFFKV